MQTTANLISCQGFSFYWNQSQAARQNNIPVIILGFCLHCCGDVPLCPESCGTRPVPRPTERAMFQLEPLPSQVCRDDAVLGLQHLVYATASQKDWKNPLVNLCFIGKNKSHPHLSQKTWNCRVCTPKSPVQGQSLLCSSCRRHIDAMAQAYAKRFVTSPVISPG